MMLVGLDGKISADTGAPSIHGNMFAYADLLDDSAVSGERTSLVTQGRKIYWVVVAPVRAPVPIAFIAAWIPVDDAMLGKLAGLSDIPLSIALASNDPRNHWAILARTANGPANAALISARFTAYRRSHRRRRQTRRVLHRRDGLEDGLA